MPTTPHTLPHTRPETRQDSLWQAGWYRFAKRVDSPHFGARPEGTQIDLIVLHSISLPPGVYGGPHVVNFLSGQGLDDTHPYFKEIESLKVSAHFLIRRHGELIQLVSCDARAWHAGVSSYRERDNCNDDSIGIELEGLEGQPFEAEQYETLSSLCASIAQHYPIAHVAGHEHIAPARKKDPGVGFDWQSFKRSLGWKSNVFPKIT
jgi:AmpD protein